MSELPLQPIYELNINGAIITNENFTAEIEILMNCSFEPDIFKVKIFNIDQLTQNVIVKGGIISIVLGYKANIKSRIITGVITNIKRYEKDNDWVTEFRGIDYSIYKLKQKTINLSLNNSKDVIEIINNICKQSGVKLSKDSVLSGIILNNYTIRNNAFNAILHLTERINYNVTSKLSELYVTSSIISTIVASNLTDDLGYTFYKSSGLNQNNNNEINGLTFIGNGISVLIPMKIVNVNSIIQGITGNYVIESIQHKFTINGYICTGNLIESKETPNIINLISNDLKALTSVMKQKMENIVNEKKNIETGIVEEEFTNDRLITAKIGLDPTKNKSILNRSIESVIGLNNVFVNKKPLMSPFVGNGFGFLFPTYQYTRCVLGYNNFDGQDINILGFLWDKNWTIPEHDKGDIMIHHKNHSKMVMKEDGSEQIQVKSLKIEVGSNGLTVSKPISSSDGELLIEFDDGSKIQFDGSKWILNTTGSIEIGSSASSVKLAGGGKKVGRLGDNVGIDSGLLTWLNSHLHPSIGSPPATPFTGSYSGQIAQSSTKTEVD